MTQKLGFPILIALASLGLAACAAGADDGESVDSDSAALSGKAASSTAEERYIVKFRDYSKRDAALSAAGAKKARELPSHAAVAAIMPAAHAEALAKNPNVEYVEADAKRYPSAQTKPYGISQVQADDPVFANATADVKVCIIDSGLHTGHEDISGLPVTGAPGNLAWNQDGCGHGTHVAGTIAGLNNTAGVVGVAPNAVGLHIVRVFGDDCSWTYSSTLVTALDECRKAGAKVVSMSLGGTTKSVTEDSAFANAYSAGVLSIAAAGNAGNTQTSYPAGYASVMSVAAVDSAKALATFSQRNADVEVAAPGVQVLSTVPWTTPSLNVGGSSYAGGILEGAAAKSVTGALVNGGLCDSVGAWAGKVVLCQRGTISFGAKVNNVVTGGGAGAVIYNNVSGGFSGTLGTGVTSTIPGISISMEDGQILVASALGQSSALHAVSVKPGSGYDAWDGTSMATPHVSGVAALLWSLHPTATNAQIRDALNKTAQDLGTAGRDASFGYGLVQAKAAHEFLQGGGGPTCGASGATCSAGTECCSGTCGVKGKAVCK
jgi:subtilisin family serine protease